MKIIIEAKFGSKFQEDFILSAIKTMLVVLESRHKKNKLTLIN